MGMILIYIIMYDLFSCMALEIVISCDIYSGLYLVIKSTVHNDDNCMNCNY